MGVWDESNCRDESFIVEMMNLPLGINDRETPFSGNDMG